MCHVFAFATNFITVDLCITPVECDQLLLKNFVMIMMNCYPVVGLLVWM